jgi:hypothetical protein
MKKRGPPDATAGRAADGFLGLAGSVATRCYRETGHSTRAAIPRRAVSPSPKAPLPPSKAVNMGERTEPRERQVRPKRRARPNGQVKIVAVRAGGGVLMPCHSNPLSDRHSGSEPMDRGEEGRATVEFRGEQDGRRKRKKRAFMAQGGRFND